VTIHLAEGDAQLLRIRSRPSGVIGRPEGTRADQTWSPATNGWTIPSRIVGEPALNTGSKSPAYDRHLLLEGAKRNAVLDLTEVQRYGMESWGDPDYVCI